jgi:hypothetical protein
MNRHLTEDEICRAIAGQSTLDEQRHLRVCPTCGAELSHWRQTFAAFRLDVRDRADRTVPPVSALADPTAGVRARAAAGRAAAGRAAAGRAAAGRAAGRRSAVRVVAPMWSIAATLLVASLALVWQVRHSAGTAVQGELPRRVIGTGQVSTMTDATLDSANEFFPLEYSTVPITHARVVRIEVPRSAPEMFGIDPAGLVNAPHGTVVAEVVVGEDGLARAVRFVRLQTSLTKE